MNSAISAGSPAGGESRTAADGAGLARLAWRRFHAIDGFNLSLLVSFNVFLTLLPLLIVAFAFVDTLVGGTGSFAKFLTRRLLLDPQSARYVRMLIAPSQRSRAGATLVGIASFALFGGSLVTQVQAAFERGWNPRVESAPSLLRGFAWLLVAAVFNLALMIPVSLTTRAVVGAPLLLVATFVQSCGFFWWTGRFISSRRRPWLTYLPGALWIGLYFTVLVAIANPVFGPILDAYHAAFGPFGSAIVICVLLFIVSVGVIATPCVSAAFWEWRGAPRESVVVPSWRERRRIASQLSDVTVAAQVAFGDTPEAPPDLPPHEHDTRSWVRYTPYLLKDRVEALRRRGGANPWTGIPLTVYERYKDSDGQNLASAVAMSGVLAAIPALITVIAVIDGMVQGQHTFGDAIVRLLALRGRQIDAVVRDTIASAPASRGWFGLALLTALPFAPLLLTNAERLMNRPWQPDEPDRRHAGRSIAWGAVAAVLLVLTTLPLVFGRVTAGIPWPALTTRSALFLLLACLMLTQRPGRWTRHLPGVGIGTVLALAVSGIGGTMLGSWVEYYLQLFGRIGVVMVFLTWAWVACAAWAIVPDVNAAIAEWRERPGLGRQAPADGGEGGGSGEGGNLAAGDAGLPTSPAGSGT